MQQSTCICIYCLDNSFFCSPWNYSEMRGLLRVGFGSEVFSAVHTRDIFVRLKAFIALQGESYPQTSRRRWLCLELHMCDGSVWWIWSVWWVLFPESLCCSAPKEKGQQEGVSLVKAGLNMGLGFLSPHQVVHLWHVTPCGPNRTEMLGKKTSCLQFF